MLVDLQHAVGNYLHDVFVVQLDWWIVLGFVGAGAVHHALPGAVDRLRAGRPQRHADGVLGVLDRRRRAAVRLCALSPRSGVHPRAGARRVHLSAQSLFRAAREASGGRVHAPDASPRSRARGRRSGRRRPRARCGSGRPGRPASISSRCGTARSRTGSRGSRSRPTRRRCRTASAH